MKFRCFWFSLQAKQRDFLYHTHYDRHTGQWSTSALQSATLKMFLVCDFDTYWVDIVVEFWLIPPLVRVMLNVYFVCRSLGFQPFFAPRASDLLGECDEMRAQRD